MSLPSDVNPDVSEAMERVTRPRRPRQETLRLARDQQGWLFAAFVAFLGVTYFGPALARYRRRPSLKDRVVRRAREAQWEARKAGLKARRRLRRLGGGSIRL